MGTTPDRQYGRELATEPEVIGTILPHLAAKGVDARSPPAGYTGLDAA